MNKIENKNKLYILLLSNQNEEVSVLFEHI